MRITIQESAEQRARRAADAVVAALAAREAPVLGVATGSSPVGVYAELADRVAEGRLDLAGVRVFALDEYVGLGAADPRSYAATVDRDVTVPLRLDPARVRVPDGTAADLAAAAAAYERAIAEAGGVTVQIAGIGANGHLAFNEPGAPFDSRTRQVSLTQETRAANARFFADPGHVPDSAVTQGIGTVLEAGRIVVVAQGDDKAEAVRAAIEGPVSPACPASALQTHPDVLWVLDPAAAALLTDPANRFAD